MNYLTRDYLASLPFKPFTPDMYEGFAGVTSPVPLFCDDGDYLVIIDGVHAEMFDDEGELIETCDDITML